MSTIVLEPGNPRYNFGNPRYHPVDEEVARTLRRLTRRSYLNEDDVQALRDLGLEVEIQERFERYLRDFSPDVEI